MVYRHELVHRAAASLLQLSRPTPSFALQAAAEEAGAVGCFGSQYLDKSDVQTMLRRA